MEGGGVFPSLVNLHPLFALLEGQNTPFQSSVYLPMRSVSGGKRLASFSPSTPPFVACLVQLGTSALVLMSLLRVP